MQYRATPFSHSLNELGGGKNKMPTKRYASIKNNIERHHKHTVDTGTKIKNIREKNMGGSKRIPGRDQFLLQSSVLFFFFLTHPQTSRWMPNSSVSAEM